MPRGGARPNAGRKKGAATKRTRAIADAALKDGITPLEVMLDNMRFYHSEGARKLAEVLLPESQMAKEAQIEGIKALFELRAKAGEAAKDAAGYCHPRMSPTDGKKTAEGTVPLHERLDQYAADDAIAASGGKVVPMVRK